MTPRKLRIDAQEVAHILQIIGPSLLNLIQREEDTVLKTKNWVNCLKLTSKIAKEQTGQEGKGRGES